MLRRRTGLWLDDPFEPQARTSMFLSLADQEVIGLARSKGENNGELNYQQFWCSRDQDNSTGMGVLILIVES